MKLLLWAIVASAAAAATAKLEPEVSFHQITTTSNIRGRELYTEYTCQDPNGRDIRISSSCCEQIANFQKQTKYISQCNQLGFPCTLTKNETHNMECVYDIPKENAECAEQTKATCHTFGGKITENNVTLQCKGITLFMKNQLNCLGTSCTDKDLQEYLLAMSDLDMSRLPPDWRNNCRYTEINGESVTQMKRDNAIASFVSGLLVFFVVGLYLCLRIAACVPDSWLDAPRRPQRSGTFQPVATVQLSPIRGSRPVAKAENGPEGEFT